MNGITLLTDFGIADTYVGQMKGVIAQIAPDARVIDLTHAVAPQDVLAGAIELDGAVDAFPAGTIHVAVVDPGVGSARQAMAVQTEHFTFVGPDNGLFTPLLARSNTWRAVALSESAYHRPEVSATFHGRDIFAPVAAHLARGTPLEALGERIESPQRLEWPGPQVVESEWRGEVLLIDHFGNCITNFDRPALAEAGVEEGSPVTIEAGAARLAGLAHTFSDVREGEAVAYVGSSGRLEIAVRNGAAAKQLGLKRGDRVVLKA